MIYQNIDFSKCDIRFSKVLIEIPGETIPLDILEFALPQYFLYINDKTIAYLFEEYKYSHHVFKLFSN